VLKLRGFVLAAAVSAVAAALWPAAGSAATLKGVVVAREHGTMLVASAAGHVSAVRGAAAVGSRVTVGGGHATVVGLATRAHLRGIVLRHVGRTTFIASDRHLLAFHSRDTTPAPPGTVISAQVGIANGQLDEQDEDDVGQIANGTITVQATVTAVAAGSVTLTVEGQSLTVSLPGGLTLPASLVGQTVTIQLSVAGANDDQGDDDHGDGDHGGDHGGGGDG
jgi:hypothetical protein